MAKKISNKDFIEEGFGKPLLDFFKQLDAQITESTKKVQGLATELKKEISANKLTSGADVQKLSKQKEQTETIKKLFKEQEQARKELAKIAEREAKLLHIKGYISWLLGQNEQSLEYFYQSLAVKENVGNRKEIDSDC